MGLALLGLGSEPVLAQRCVYRGAIAPAPTTRTYQHRELGFTFEIPANFRAMGLENSRVAFYDPATFEYVQCAVRSRQVPQVAPAATLYVNYAPLQESSLLALTQRVRPWLFFYQPAYEPIAAGNIPVLPYRYVHEIYGNSVQALSFRSPDQQWLVTLEGAPDNPVTPLALTTLQP
ncbi:MAG: hypothetical protein ICV62_02320 [Cyanobacteria bacterium Co-bin13]|nr:hypothetical protein [Cyanobacteria bacterium Co-bin13]